MRALWLAMLLDCFHADHQAIQTVQCGAAAGPGRCCMRGLAVITLLGALLAMSPLHPPDPGSRIRIDALAVPLNPAKPDQTAIGEFVYAGGLALSSQQTRQLHGLSDLEVSGTNRLTAVGDVGSLLEARLVF